MKFTVTWMSHQYEKWYNVEADSQESLENRIDEEGIESLGESDKQDTTDSFVEIEAVPQKTLEELQEYERLCRVQWEYEAGKYDKECGAGAFEKVRPFESYKAEQLHRFFSV